MEKRIIEVIAKESVDIIKEFLILYCKKNSLKKSELKGLLSLSQEGSTIKITEISTSNVLFMLHWDKLAQPIVTTNLT